MKYIFKTALTGLAAIALHISPATALTIDPIFAGDYTATDLGSIAGLPENYGGMTFKNGDPNTLLIGGAANGAGGLTYEVSVTRDGSNNIVSFGTPTAFGTVGEYNDGGIAYGPGGVLFTAQWPENKLGQTKPGSVDEDKIIDLGPLGVPGSISGLNFVPGSIAGAGKFKFITYGGGSWFDVALSPDGNGTYNITSATEKVILPGGPEGFVFIDSVGNAGFSVDSLLIAEYAAGKIATYDLDANGDPILSSRREFITGLTGAEGAVIDPVTGDFLFSTFGGGSRIVRVDGFVPQPTGIPEPSIIVILGLGFVGLGLARRRGSCIWKAQRTT